MIDDIPGGRLAVNVIDFGLKVGGGPIRAAVAEVYNRAQGRIIDYATDLFTAAGYRSDAQPGAVGLVAIPEFLAGGITGALGFSKRLLGNGSSGGRTESSSDSSTPHTPAIRFNLADLSHPASLTSRHTFTAGRRNDGIAPEALVRQELSAATGIEFRGIQNRSNHGADALGIDHDNRVIWSVDSKSSTTGRFADAPDLAARTESWITRGATGELNGQQLTQPTAAYARELQGLLRQGYTIRPMVAQVTLPSLNTTGPAHITLVPR